MGLLEARQDHYAEAIHYYRKAQALDPAMPGLTLNLGLSFLKTAIIGRPSNCSIR